jgi:hypothetical protein
MLAAFVLPSSLKLPQTNPTQTLEYAPVPPTDQDSTPPLGNLGSLGLGVEATGPVADAFGGVLDGAAPPPAPAGTGGTPRTKRCIGTPPRQTEDPLAPPCVAFFEGNNFGSTYQGVTSNEIRVLVYQDDNCISATSRGEECPKKNYLNDLDKPAEPDEFVNDRGLRAFVRFFNARFQTYNRRIHVYVYHRDNTTTGGSPGTTASPEMRTSDAAALYQELRPFASFNYSLNYVDDFLKAMARKGVMNFGSLGPRPASFYQAYPRLIWSYLPSLEQQVANYVSYVCTSIVGFPVAASGNAGPDGTPENGKPRKLGLLHTTDAGQPQLQRFAELTKQGIERCGGKFVADDTFPQTNAVSSAPNKSAATRAMADFQQKGVTTVIWPQGYETENSHAAGQINYFPEWVLAGDGQLDGFGPGFVQDQKVWDRHAFATTALAIVGKIESTPCWQALGEADPQMPEIDRKIFCGLRSYYPDLRQLFTGIQVAGPRLTPTTIDQGFRAIPPKASSDPRVPACYYEPGDYTCVKDAATEWWDRTQTSSANTPGCYRLIDGGRRYPAGSWPRRNGLAATRPVDFCSQHQGGVGNVRTT